LGGQGPRKRNVGRVFFGKDVLIDLSEWTKIPKKYLCLIQMLNHYVPTSVEVNKRSKDKKAHILIRFDF
jgi:hypothetical protein